MMSMDDLKEDQQDNLLNELRSKDNDYEGEEVKESDKIASTSAGNVSKSFNINKKTNLEDDEGKKEAVGRRGSI